MINVNIIAILVSPVIAVLVSIWVQNRKEKKLKRFFIFSSLMSTRHLVAPSDEIVRALNMIDVVFCDEEKIRQLWREYFEMVHNPNTINLWNDKKLELLTEMAKVVGYKKSISMIDVKRVYYPVGLAEDAMRARAISEEFLRALREGKGLQVVPKDESKEAPAPSGVKK
jgi:hypothetical protein